MADARAGGLAGLVVGRGEGLVIGDVGFSDASWVPYGLERGRARGAAARTFDEHIRLVFEGGVPYLAKAARLLGAACETTGRGCELAPERLAACAGGVPPSREEALAIAGALGTQKVPELPAGGEEVAEGELAAALKRYEDLVRAVAFGMAFRAAGAGGA